MIHDISTTENRLDEINAEVALLQTEINAAKDIVLAGKEALHEYVLRRAVLLKEKEKLSKELV